MSSHPSGKKFRVSCANDFLDAARSSEQIENLVTYYYVETHEEAAAFMKKISDIGAYQSDMSDDRNINFYVDGHILSMSNPNIAGIEYWDDEEQEWCWY